MKILALLTFSMLVFLSACATRTPAPVDPVDWKKVVAEHEEILAPRSVKGPHEHRGEVETGLELWELSLQLELWGKGAEGDKARARAYIAELARKAQQVRLPACTAWLRFRKQPCDNGD